MTAPTTEREPLLVSGLEEFLAGPDALNMETTLGRLRVAEDASSVAVRGEDREFPFDEAAERAIADFLGIPKHYLAKCPSDLKAVNVNAWLQSKEDSAAMLSVINGGIVGVHGPDVKILPPARVAHAISNVIDGDAEVVQVIRDSHRLHIDIKTANAIEVPNPNRVHGRPEVGDITHGGIRVLTCPDEARPPSVQGYFHRLWCSNGATTRQQSGLISLKGLTVDEVLLEMEEAARLVLSGLDNRLEEIAHMAQVAAPGNPTSFAHQLGREYRLGPNVMNRVIDRVNLLPQDASVYDVQQAFTEVANRNVPYATMMRLQELGGDLAFHTDHVVHRCHACERLLPE